MLSRKKNGCSSGCGKNSRVLRVEELKPGDIASNDSVGFHSAAAVGGDIANENRSGCGVECPLALGLAPGERPEPLM